MAGFFAVTMLVLVGNAPVAQTNDTLPRVAPPGFFTLLTPGNLSLTLVGEGYISDHFAVTDQSLQAEQSVTRALGLVGRVTGYQLFLGDHIYNPLVSTPSKHGGHNHDYNFARLQGGIDYHLSETSSLMLLGGGDVGDSRSASVEGDFSTWLLLNRPHPVNIAASSIYTNQNGVVANEIDLRTIVFSRETYSLIAGAGGAFYSGGFVDGASGQGGPMFGIYSSKWQMGLDIQSGYGNAKEYGEITAYKQFNWTE